MVLRGYRTEDFEGSGERNPVSIAIYERKELGNTDIQDYLFSKGKIKHATIKEAVAYLKKMHAGGYTRAVWVCRKPTEVSHFYYNTAGKLPKIKKYTFTDYFIISDLGSGGILVVFKGTVKVEPAVLRPVGKKNYTYGKRRGDLEP